MKNLKYFQDLPDELKEVVFEEIKNHLIEEGEITKENIKEGQDMEITDDWINRNNTPYFWKDWVGNGDE